jgi:integrase
MNNTKSKRLPSVNVECRKANLNPKGEAPLYIRITINRRSNYISLKKYVNPVYFDSKKQKMKAGDNRKMKINSYITFEKEKIETIILDLHRSNRPLTFEAIRELYLKGEFKDFIEFVKEEVYQEELLKSISPNTISGVHYFTRVLAKYKSRIKISEIDENFINHFEAYLKNVVGYKPNTVKNHVKNLGKYLRRAYEKNLTDSTAFQKITHNFIETHKEYLTFEELESLHQIYLSKRLLNEEYKDKLGRVYYKGNKYHKTLQHFLIGCYTGLRHSDVMRLRRKHFKNGIIEIEMKKTGNVVRIPVRDKLLEIIDLNREDHLICDWVDNNWRTNDRLKFIRQFLGIKKQFSFHSSRHTFAILSLLLDIPLEVVSDILGHTDLNITKKFYAKIVDNMREKHMDKWNQLPSNSTNQKVININDYEKQKLLNRIAELEEQLRSKAFHLSSQSPKENYNL